jgi:hypothetical protein
VIAFLRTFPWASLLFVIGAQVTVFTDALSIEVSVMMLAFKGLLGPALGVVAVLAHTIGIVFFIGMPAL